MGEGGGGGGKGRLTILLTTREGLTWRFVPKTLSILKVTTAD